MQGHRATECDATVAEWLQRSMLEQGPVQTKLKVAQLIAGAEIATQQERLARGAGLRGDFEVERRRDKAEKKQQKRAAQWKYAQQRKVRQARQAAERARHKASVALEAAQRGEYPQPWATVAEARAKRKEAEARRRAAVQLQQVAQQAQVLQHQRDRLWQAGQGMRRQQNSFRQQDRANTQAKGLARHKEIEAQVQERNSRIEVDRARQQEKEVQQDLAKQRRQDRLKAQQAQEQFRQWQAQTQGLGWFDSV